MWSQTCIKPVAKVLDTPCGLSMRLAVNVDMRTRSKTLCSIIFVLCIQMLAKSVGNRSRRRNPMPELTMEAVGQDQLGKDASHGAFAQPPTFTLGLLSVSKLSPSTQSVSAADANAHHDLFFVQFLPMTNLNTSPPGSPQRNLHFGEIGHAARHFLV